MFEIKKFSYSLDTFDKIKEYRYGRNWPVVYLMEDGRELYVGETSDVFNRSKQHFTNPERAKLKDIFVIADDEYNKSATLDIESQLIKYFSGDGRYLLQNGNQGMQEADYYDRERYQAKFEVIWKELQKANLADKDLLAIENTDLFKYSPYKALTTDQLDVVESITNAIKSGIQIPNLVSGEPGTGKTIVATYLMKLLSSSDWSKDLKIGLVIPMTSLRLTLERVFRKVKGLNSNMILGPTDVVKEKYDILIVDEAHRLSTRKNQTNFPIFDRVNEVLELDKYEGTQLDWILKSSKYQVFFYDKDQSIKPADINFSQIENTAFNKHYLVSQMRVRAGEDYVQYIKNVLNGTQTERKTFNEYDLRMVDKISDLVGLIKQKDNVDGLSRLLAGYAWEWKTGKDASIDYDIEIDGTTLRWNSTTKDWVNSKNAVNEVGCIHTIQGYDLNYAGVIIGPEVSFDTNTRKLTIDKSKYMDFNGKRSITDPNELEVYIKNIYKTLLTRGIKGTYVYVIDEALREYLCRFL